MGPLTLHSQASLLHQTLSTPFQVECAVRCAGVPFSACGSITYSEYTTEHTVYMVEISQDAGCYDHGLLCARPVYALV